MKTVAVIFSFVGTVILIAYGALIWYDNTFPFGRMWETPGIWPHEKPLPIMEAGVVPFSGGEAIYRNVPAEQLKSPIDFKSSEVVARGKIGYGKFCAPCHGPDYDGQGTVGQSFAPLPLDLRSEKVQNSSEGSLFKEISYGIEGKRQPPLATTISPTGRWEIIAYVKSLGVRP